MSVEFLQTLSIVFYILAGIFALIAIVLFFVLDIKKVVGDVTGSTARKAINAIRTQNEASGNKAYKPSPVNAARGKLTDKITPSGRILPQTAMNGGSTGTEKFDTTELLLGSEATTVLDSASGETTVLSEADGETTVLKDGFNDASRMENKAKFSTDVEMGFAESSEIIE